MATLPIALALGVAACSGDSADSGSGGTPTTGRPEVPPVETGGSITFGIESDTADLRPGFAAQPAEVAIGLGIFDQLMTYNADNELEPNLAESLEDSGDLMEWTMTLHAGITFHEGTPLNAAAVTSHFEHLKDPATGCQCQANAANIDSMDMPEGPDGLTVVFHLLEPSVAFPAYLATSSGWIESPAARTELGDDFARNPVGTGAFRLTEYSSSNRYVLTRFDGYWQVDENGIQLPYADEVVFRPIPDSTQRLASLRAGDIDMFQTAGTSEVTQAEADGFAAQQVSGASSTIILMNESRPPFDDVRARLALAYAIDRDAIDRTPEDGQQVPAFSYFAPDSPYFNEDALLPDHDLDRARELVDELGGLEFTIECIPEPDAIQLLATVKQMGEAAGMRIETETQEQGAYVSRLFSRAGDYEAACFRSSHFVDPDAIRSSLTTDDSGNLVFYSNEEMDRLLEEGRSTSDPPTRGAAYARVQELIAEEIPTIMLSYDLWGNVYDQRKVGPPPPSQPNSLGAVKPAYFYRVDS